MSSSYSPSVITSSSPSTSSRCCRGVEGEMEARVLRRVDGAAWCRTGDGEVHVEGGGFLAWEEPDDLIRRALRGAESLADDNVNVLL